MRYLLAVGFVAFIGLAAADSAQHPTEIGVALTAAEMEFEVGQATTCPVNPAMLSTPACSVTATTPTSCTSTVPPAAGCCVLGYVTTGCSAQASWGGAARGGWRATPKPFDCNATRDTANCYCANNWLGNPKCYVNSSSTISCGSGTSTVPSC